MQWKRGLWRLGWILWAMMVVPTIYISYQESIEPDYQWYAVYLDAAPSSQNTESGLKRIDVPDVGWAYVPKYFTDEQTEKALSALEKIAAPTQHRENAATQKVYTCTVQWKANRPKIVLYSMLGLGLGFVLIQGGFRMILWVTSGFRNE